MYAMQILLPSKFEVPALISSTIAKTLFPLFTILNNDPISAVSAANPLKPLVAQSPLPTLRNTSNPRETIHLSAGTRKPALANIAIPATLLHTVDLPPVLAPLNSCIELKSISFETAEEFNQKGLKDFSCNTVCSGSISATFHELFAETCA